ncbi:hypothetical protein SMICM304S_01233 [Streptomyces microflavus]
MCARTSSSLREVWRRPAGLAPDATSVDTYAGGVFKELRCLHGHVTQLGYRSRGGYAVCRSSRTGSRPRRGSGSASTTVTTSRHRDGPPGLGPTLGRALTAAAESAPSRGPRAMRMAAALCAGRDMADQEQAA